MQQIFFHSPIRYLIQPSAHSFVPFLSSNISSRPTERQSRTQCAHRLHPSQMYFQKNTQPLCALPGTHPFTSTHTHAHPNVFAQIEGYAHKCALKQRKKSSPTPRYTPNSFLMRLHLQTHTHTPTQMDKMAYTTLLLSAESVFFGRTAVEKYEISSYA